MQGRTDHGHTLDLMLPHGSRLHTASVADGVQALVIREGASVGCYMPSHVSEAPRDAGAVALKVEQ